MIVKAAPGARLLFDWKILVETTGEETEVIDESHGNRSEVGKLCLPVAVCQPEA